MRNQASPELRVLQERNIWGQSYAMESSRISECSGIQEPRQGKRDSTQARPLQTFSSLASIGSQGLKSTFLLHNVFLLLLNLGKCSHNFVTFLLEYAVLCLVHVFLSDCRVLLIDLLLTGTLGNSR
jgi:hypothetical protein